MAWPKCFHTVEQIREPLTRYVIADEQKQNGDASYGGCKYVVHVRIAGSQLATLEEPRYNQTYRSPFWRLPTPVGNTISERPQNAPPTPVYRRPLVNLVFAWASAWNPTHVLIYGLRRLSWQKVMQNTHIRIIGLGKDISFVIFTRQHISPSNSQPWVLRIV